VEPLKRQEGTIRDIRGAGWIGLATLPLMILALALTADSLPHLWPTWNESTTSIAGWFHTHRAIGLVQVLAGSVGLTLWVWFVAGLTTCLEAAGSRSVATRLMVPLAAAASVGMQVSSGSWVLGLLSQTPGHPMSDDLTRFTFDAAAVSYFLAQLYIALLMFATGTAMLQARISPTWTWSTFGIGVVNALGSFVILIGTGWLAPVSLPTAVPYLLFTVWTVVLSAVLVRHPNWGS
jgi:hypothetical protein